MEVEFTDQGLQSHTEECDDGNPPAWTTVLISNSLPYKNTEVNGLESCPITIESPAAIKTLAAKQMPIQHICQQNNMKIKKSKLKLERNPEFEKTN